MADIKITQTDAAGKQSVIEINGMDFAPENTIESVLERIFGKTATIPEPTQTTASSGQEHKNPPACNMRVFRPRHITPGALKEAIRDKQLNAILQPFDEIDIPLDTGETVTVVCGYVEPEWARFVFKDCWDETVMNDEPTNKTGYHGSKGRRHVLEGIWPHIDPGWRKIIKPRKMVEIIDGKTVEYTDPMWLPSATDMFGPSEGGYWKDLDDSFQLPIFEKEHDRIKECGNNGTYPYWLRSVYAGYASLFRYVGTSGRDDSCSAIYLSGFAPGFDI